jgi:hypothetical protein
MMVLNDELERTWMEVVAVCFKTSLLVQSQDFRGNTDNSSLDSLFSCQEWNFNNVSRFKAEVGTTTL